MFITNNDTRNLFDSSTKKPLMGRFYEYQRKSQKILVNEDGTPHGGNGVSMK